MNYEKLKIFVLLLLSAMSIISIAETANVSIHDYSYVPAELTIKKGTVVTWTNNDKRLSHSILFLGVNGFESERFFPDESWQYTFTTPGVYKYSCGPQSQMSGTITVLE